VTRADLSCTLAESPDANDRHPRTLSLLLIDVDFFKKFNDAYGHQEGDRCLAAVARALQETVNGASTVAKHVTISIGGASTVPGGGPSEELLAAADKALYLAKEHGRNRVTVWKAETVQSRRLSIQGPVFVV